jgi:hypothetical protein
VEVDRQDNNFLKMERGRRLLGNKSARGY